MPKLRLAVNSNSKSAIQFKKKKKSAKQKSAKNKQPASQQKNANPQIIKPKFNTVAL